MIRSPNGTLDKRPSSRPAPVALQCRGLTGSPAVCRTDRRGKPVTQAEIRSDKAAIIAESFAQGRDLNLQVLLGDEDAWPDTAQEILLADQCTIGLEQYKEEIKGAGSERDGDSFGKQQALAQQYFKTAELDRRSGLPAPWL